MEIANVHQTVGKLFYKGSDFWIGIIHHEVRWCLAGFHPFIMASASFIEAWSSDWHMNSATTLYPTLVCTRTKESGIAYLVILYVASIRTSSPVAYLWNIRFCHGSWWSHRNTTRLKSPRQDHPNQLLLYGVVQVNQLWLCDVLPLPLPTWLHPSLYLSNSQTLRESWE